MTGVREDSRRVRPGDLFVARPGASADGARFLADAASRGAVAAVAASRPADAPLPVVVAPDVDSAAASVLANALHGDPTRGDGAVRAVGVTGTNGKTTVAYLVRHLLGSAGVKCGLIGTVETDDGRDVRTSEMTTPAATDVADLLAAMRANGCGAAAVEASSHALHQGRLAGVRFAAAGFTNLTGDHLDYHGTMDEYADAKARLFASLDADAVACVNADDPASARMAAACDARACGTRVVRLSPSGRDGAEWWASGVTVTAEGTRFDLSSPGGSAAVSMRLVGRHNVENALCAAAIAGEAFGMTAEQIAAGLGDAGGAPGRLQRVDAGQPFGLFVDYAHTDDALANVLSALRPLTAGRLRVVFGCGGDRDKTKRPRMAAAAERLADDLYLTSDNPRTEDPLAILADVAAGLTPGGRSAATIDADRRVAVRRAVADAVPGDVVLVAGKGHEDYQIVGTARTHFDDAEEARAAVAARGVARERCGATEGADQRIAV